MSNRGPKTNFSHEMRVIELQKHDIFYENGKVKKESDPVWVKICANLNKGLDPKEKPISVRNIQTYVAQNRNHVIQDIKKDSANTSNLRPHNEEVNNADFNTEERLLKITNNALYKPIIRDLCTYPFIVFHWTFEALDLVSNFKEGVLIFGVAGSPCQPFIAPDKTVSKNIFLFTFGIDVLNEYIPICEFSSEENSVSLVNRFFYECLRSGLKIPKKLTVDYYCNHIISANLVFNVNISLEKYLTMCYKNLINKESELPKCIITTDVRLLVIKVKKWDCISNIALQSVKKFFIYSIILLSIQRNLLDFQNILRKLFVIAYSIYQNEHTNSSINYFMTEIKDKQINLNYNDKYIEETENHYRDFLNLEIDDNLNYKKCQQITNFITDTFVESRIYVSRQEGVERNAYFNEHFCHDLIRLCVRFPLWTNIMSDELDTKDISILKIHEQQFKQYLLKECDDLLPTVDKYLITKIDYNKTKITFARDSMNQRLIKKKDIVELENTYLYYEENWKGLNPNENLSEESDVSDSDADELSDDSLSSTSIYDNNDDSLMMENSQNDVTISRIVESFCKTLKEDNDINESHEDLKTNSIESSCDENMIVDYTHQKDNVSSTAAQCENTIIETAASENKQLLSRGKFLRPCPEIELLQQKPIKNNKNQSKSSKRKERKLIQNANLYPPRKVNRQSVIVKTSSHFDCILEILTTVYSLIQTFKEFVDNPTKAMQRKHADFLSILQSYISNFNLTSLYNARVKFLTEICNSEDEFSWTKNIGDFYKEIMFPNIFVKFNCPYCNTDSYEHFNTIKLSYKHLSADTINNAISASVCSQCTHCKNRRDLKNIETNYLLCLDVEDSTQDTLNLNHIKITLDLEEQSLILVGVIGFEEPIGKEKLRHYVAYSRNFHGIWLKYDSTQLSKRISRLPKNEFDVKVAVVIYAKYDLGE